MIHPEGLIPDHGLDGWQPETGEPGSLGEEPVISSAVTPPDQFLLEPGQPIPHAEQHLNDDQPVIPTHFTDEALIGLHQAGELGLYFDHFAPVVINNADGQGVMFTEFKGTPPTLAQLSERYGAYLVSDCSRLGLAVGALGAWVARTVERCDSWVDRVTSHIPFKPVREAASAALRVGGRVVWLGVLVGCSPAVQITLTPSPDSGLTQPGPDLTPSPDVAQLMPVDLLGLSDAGASLAAALNDGSNVIQNNCVLDPQDYNALLNVDPEAKGVEAFVNIALHALEVNHPPALESLTCNFDSDLNGFQLYFTDQSGEMWIPTIDGFFMPAKLTDGRLEIVVPNPMAPEGAPYPTGAPEYLPSSGGAVPEFLLPEVAKENDSILASLTAQDISIENIDLQTTWWQDGTNFGWGTLVWANLEHTGIWVTKFDDTGEYALRPDYRSSTMPWHWELISLPGGFDGQLVGYFEKGGYYPQILVLEPDTSDPQGREVLGWWDPRIGDFVKKYVDYRDLGLTEDEWYQRFLDFRMTAVIIDKRMSPQGDGKPVPLDIKGEAFESDGFVGIAYDAWVRVARGGVDFNSETGEVSIYVDIVFGGKAYENIKMVLGLPGTRVLYTKYNNYTWTSDGGGTLYIPSQDAEIFQSELKKIGDMIKEGQEINVSFFTTDMSEIPPGFCVGDEQCLKSIEYVMATMDFTRDTVNRILSGQDLAEGAFIGSASFVGVGSRLTP